MVMKRLAKSWQTPFLVEKTSNGVVEKVVEPGVYWNSRKSVRLISKRVISTHSGPSARMFR